MNRAERRAAQQAEQDRAAQLAFTTKHPWVLVFAHLSDCASEAHLFRNLSVIEAGAAAEKHLRTYARLDGDTVSRDYHEDLVVCSASKLTFFA